MPADPAGLLPWAELPAPNRLSENLQRTKAKLMLISDLLSPERIRCDVHSSSKKRLLEIISKELARNSDELDQREVFESLCARERLGSTGLGGGVAIPHGRIKGSNSVHAAFIRLKKPLAFSFVLTGFAGCDSIRG